MKKSSAVWIGLLRGDARAAMAIVCVLAMIQTSMAQTPQGQPQAPAAEPAGAEAPPPKPLAPEQLDSLVAPIALYPDALLSQVLVASTYPLEVVECKQWLDQNPTLKDKALADAATKQQWDASVQALVAFPDVLKRLDENIPWMTDLGNAFLAQQEDVMNAVQRLRKKAEESGALKTTEQQTVTTKTEGNEKYVVVQPANPQVVYVPTYNPTVIWGAPMYYPYPPIYYPPAPVGAVVAASMISFGVGMAIGAMWGGGWGWGCGWGYHSSVHVNATFISSNHFSSVNVGRGNTWQHNPAHRAGVPYNNRDVSNRFNSARNTGNLSRPSVGQTQNRLSQADRGNIGQNRAGQGNIGQNRGNLGGSDRIGHRNVNSGGFGSGGGAFGDLNRGGGRAQMNSSRGSWSRGGGGFGGGGRRR